MVRHTLRWVLLGVGALFLVIMGVACGSGDGSPGATDTGFPDSPKQTAPAKPPPTTKANTFGSGTWEVGKDIKAGTYKTIVPEDSFGCYWERDKNLTGDFNAIITNDNQQPKAHVTVTIKSSDAAFKSEGCGTWTLQK